MTPIEKLKQACQLVSEVGEDADVFVNDLSMRYAKADNLWFPDSAGVDDWSISLEGLQVSWSSGSEHGDFYVPFKYVENVDLIEVLYRENRQKQLDADDRRKKESVRVEKHNAQQRESYDRKEYERLKLKYEGTEV